MTIENDATQTGATLSTEETTAPVERELTDRERMLESIAVDREGADSDPAVQTAPSSPDPEVDQVQRQMEDATLEPHALDKLRVKVKIDGVESEVTVAEMQRQFQKNGAAERRLEEATRLLNEARAAKPPLGFDPPAAPSDSVVTQQATSGDADQEGKDFLAALFDGDETKALEALKKIGLGRPAKEPTLDANQLAAQLTPAIKQQLSYDSALEKFKGDYAEIVADPYLADLADRFLDAEVQGGKPFAEALESAGKKTRDWLGSKGVQPVVPTPTIDRNTKLERKAGMDRIPALNTKATTVEEPVQSASDIINEMRKARGLTL